MPFALLVIGIFLLASSIQGTQDSLFGLLKNDFTGKNNFVVWFVAILLIGSLGYIQKFRSLSISFLGLLLIVVLVAPKGIGTTVFAQFNSALNTTTTVASSGPAATVIGPNSTALPNGVVNQPSAIGGLNNGGSPLGFPGLPSLTTIQ